MEFLRFGSSIPGKYWGCCCVDIIQDFKVDPAARTSIQLVSGDSGTSLGKFAGPTYEDIFWQRLRFGTFSTRDMPNHGFLAILTENQLKSANGLKWLAILKRAGFEFIRAISNSVGSGAELLTDGPVGGRCLNYMFGLFRNIGWGASPDPFTPPKEWTDLPKVKTETWETMFADPDFISALPGGEKGTLEKLQREVDLTIWNTLPKQDTLLTEEELQKQGVPIVMSGQRLPHAQPESKETREKSQTTAVAHNFFTPTVAAAPPPQPLPDVPPPATKA